jgi:hypothetical protein
MSLVRLSFVFLAAHVATALYFLFDRAPGTAAAWTGFPLDDAWIHMVYARSLATFHGFAYNPGQLETGSTSPLWAVLLVPASWAAQVFHISVVVPAKITSLLTAVAASVGAARLLRGLGFGLAAELVAGLAIALDPSLAFAQVSGMEVMLAGALGLWAFAELAHEHYFAAGLAAGLAPLARPEMALVTVVVLAVAEWRLQQRHAPAKTRLWVVLPAVVLVGGWMTYCLAVSGYPLPNTFYAKFASREAYLVHNLTLIFAQILPASPWFAYGAGLLVWLVGAGAAWRRGLVGRLFVAFPFLFFVGISASQLLQASEPFYFLRYVLPAHVFVVAALAVGAVSVASWAWQRRRLAYAPATLIATALLLLGALSKLPQTLRARADLFAWNCQNIEELDVAMAAWLRDNVPAGDTIAVNDAGAARYVGEHRIFDIMGLNHHGFLHQEPAAMAELSRVGFVSVFPSLSPQIQNNPAWVEVHRTSTENLTICRCPQSEMVAYRRISDAR